jgi:hypothetical protein
MRKVLKTEDGKTTIDLLPMHNGGGFAAVVQGVEVFTVTESFYKWLSKEFGESVCMELQMEFGELQQ